jgi:hypothetical protein
MQAKKRRRFGEKLNYRSLSCAPINENGVIYLFGVLQDVIDYKIESIQAGFPDCIARRCIGNGRWEEVRIEFEFQSLNFVYHKHDPNEVDIIVCWEHNWKDCPEHIEVLELSSMIGKIEEIKEEIKEPKQLSEYNRFSQEKRLEGLTFPEIANLWRELKTGKESKPQKKLTGWQKFCREKRLEGIEFSEISRLWRESKMVKT